MSKIIGCYFIPDTSKGKYPAFVHDHNLVIIDKGRIDTYLHFERYSRCKHDASMEESIDNIARNLKLVPDKKAVYVFVDNELGRAGISHSGQIRVEAPWSTNLNSGLEKARLYWFGEWPEAYILNHELAHIYSCVPFYGMFKENSLLVHSDGGASQSSFSAWLFRENKLELIEANYNYKWMSALFNANALVFSMVGAKKQEQNSVPGKFMGLEAFGEYREDIERWLVENDFFTDCWASKKKLFDSIESTFGMKIKFVDNKLGFFQDVAATIHSIFLKESLAVFNRLAKQTKAKYLYYAGGTALNIKLNSKIIQSGKFEKVYIPPCTSDAGLAIGAAVAGSLLKGQEVLKTGPYLNNFEISGYSDFSYSLAQIRKISQLIFEEKILALCNGYGETGPRALGNRSIIARADNNKIAKKISRECKNREWYRPIAPVMLERNLKYFVDIEKSPEIAKYMLAEFEILDEAKSKLEGCLHVDGTSRIQILPNKEFNPFLYDLLDILDVEYGIKALVNTSFNQQGEPIVHTHEQALKSAKEMRLDGVVLNGKLVLLKG